MRYQLTESQMPMMTIAAKPMTTRGPLRGLSMTDNSRTVKGRPSGLGFGPISGILAPWSNESSSGRNFTIWQHSTFGFTTC